MISKKASEKELKVLILDLKSSVNTIEVAVRRVLRRFNPGEVASSGDKKLIAIAKDEIIGSIKKINDAFRLSAEPAPATYFKSETLKIYEDVETALTRVLGCMSNVKKNSSEFDFDSLRISLVLLKAYLSQLIDFKGRWRNQ